MGQRQTLLDGLRLEVRCDSGQDFVDRTGDRLGDDRAAVELADVKDRIAALQAEQGTAGERLAALQSIVSDARPFAAFSEQLAELHAQKNAAVDAVASRLAPLEARLMEIEARPAGKKVKRLSLLSGGERSLTAVALLVAIFKARPSPFYVMDEVEAALDDTNLGRLLEILTELREDSQLIVITHQKRTMEIADALYGVTMRGDGVTTLISQRLAEEQRAGAR